MKNYELLYILPSNITSSEIKSKFLEIREAISKMGGKMLKTLPNHPFLVKSEFSKEELEELRDLPIIKRRLAYPIKKNRFGFYCLVNFSSSSEDVKKINEYLRMNTSVLRHIIIQADPMTEEELKKLEELFARKKAEQEKEEKKKAAERQESKEVRKEKEVAESEKKTEEKVAAAKKEEKKEEEVEKEKEEKEKEEKEKKEESPKKGKKKIKLEELEDKLDEILNETVL